MNSFHPLWLPGHKEWSSSCHVTPPAAECAATSRFNCLHLPACRWQMSQAGSGELNCPPPEYYTAVEVISVRCLNVHHASGRSTWFFPSKVPHIPVNQAVKAQTRSVAAQPYSVQLAQSDSRATSIRAGSTHCASYRDLHLWDDWSYKKCWQFSANLHMLLLLLLI